MKTLKITLFILASFVFFASANDGKRIPKRSDYPANAKFIAITFDDGPNTTYTVHVLDKLKAHGARATFYVQGQKINAATTPVLQRAIAEGHDVDSHSWDHPSFGLPVEGVPQITIASEARDNLQRTSQAIFNATGYWPWSFRAPFLEWGTKAWTGIDVLEGLDREFKMAFIDTGIDTKDYENQGSPQTIANNVLNFNDVTLDGGIILMHDDGGARPGTVLSLDILLPALKARGFEVVTVRELFILKGVTPELFHGSNVMWPRVNQRADLQNLNISPTWRHWDNFERLYPNNTNDWWLQDWWTCTTPPWNRQNGEICNDPTSVRNTANGEIASFVGIQNGQIDLQLQAGTYAAELYDLQGSLISKVEINATNGINATGLRTDNLPNGMFILHVKQAGNSVLRHKVFVK